MSANPERDVLLDASAVLALLNDEPGSDKVLECCRNTRITVKISAVNAAEVIAKLVMAGMAPGESVAAFGALHLTVVPFRLEEAVASADFIRPDAKALSLGDRACLATGRLQDTIVVTADRAWRIANLGVSVEFIR